MTLQLTRFILFLSIFSLLAIAGTNANFSDIETSAGNSFTASSLDFELAGTGFNEANLAPSSTPSASIAMSQIGSMGFDYRVYFAKTSGDDLLCNNLQLTANRDSISVYSGSLSAFDLSPISFPGPHQWDFQVSLPDNPDYQLLSCNFDFIFSSQGAGFSDTETVNNQIASGDWIAPTASLNITGSWMKVLDEKIINGNFDSGLDGWVSKGDVSIVGSSAQIGSDNDPANLTQDNFLAQTFSAGAKSLSLNYNLFTRDLPPLDDPALHIYLNGQRIFTQDTLAATFTATFDPTLYSSGWNQFIYDLSSFVSGNLSLEIHSGNTGDTANPSWTQIDKVSTWFIAAPAHAVYTLTGSPDIDYFICSVDGNPCAWINPEETQFQVPAEGSHIVNYYAVDLAGNSSASKQVTIITDDTAPNQVIDLTSSYQTQNSSLLSWTASGNDGSSNRASQYDLRYQESCSDPALFNFDSATKVEGVPSPADPFTPEELELTGLTPNTSYCVALKVGDEAPNWSSISNIAVFTTLPAFDPLSFGDLVINELMWSGTSASSADEYLELRNMTKTPLDLTQVYLTATDEFGLEHLLDIDLAGLSIPPQAFFLIANANSYATGDSQLNVAPDVWDSSLDLDEANLQINLYYQLGSAPDFGLDILLDQAGDGDLAPAGIGGGGRFYSMQRLSVPGDGTNPLSWSSSVDPSSTSLYFDGGGDERGTPGKPNDPRQPRVELAIDGENASFILFNLAEFASFNYNLTYQTDTAPQSITGAQNINGQDIITVSPLYLGSCTAGGTCTPDSSPHNFVLEVELLDSDNNVINLSDEQ